MEKITIVLMVLIAASAFAQDPARDTALVPSRAPAEQIQESDMRRNSIGLGLLLMDALASGSTMQVLADLEIRIRIGTTTSLPFLSLITNVSAGWTPMEHLERINWIFCPKAAYHHEYRLRALGAYTGLFLYRTRLKITDPDYLPALSREEVESDKYRSRNYIGLPLGVDLNWRYRVTAQAGLLFIHGLEPQYTLALHLMWPG